MRNESAASERVMSVEVASRHGAIRVIHREDGINGRAETSRTARQTDGRARSVPSPFHRSPRRRLARSRACAGRRRGGPRRCRHIPTVGRIRWTAVSQLRRGRSGGPAALGEHRRGSLSALGVAVRRAAVPGPAPPRRASTPTRGWNCRHRRRFGRCGRRGCRACSTPTASHVPTVVVATTGPWTVIAGGLTMTAGGVLALLVRSPSPPPVTRRTQPGTNSRPDGTVADS